MVGIACPKVFRSWLQFGIFSDTTPCKGRKRMMAVNCSPLKRSKTTPLHKPSPSHRKGFWESASAAILRSQYDSGLKSIMKSWKGRAAHQKLCYQAIKNDVRDKAPKGLNQRLSWKVIFHLQKLYWISIQCSFHRRWRTSHGPKLWTRPRSPILSWSMFWWQPSTTDILEKLFVGFEVSQANKDFPPSVNSTHTSIIKVNMQ